MLEKQIWHTANISMVLTDIIVFSARTKLKAQGKGGEELELLWELEWPVRRQRPVALPAFEAFGSVVTWAVAIIVDHVENVAFRPLVWDGTGVVRTVNIKVVVDADVNMVVAPVKAGKEIQYANKYNEHMQYTDMRSCFKFVWNFRIYKEIGKYFAKVFTWLWRLGLTQILSCDQRSWRWVYQELGKHAVYAAVYYTPLSSLRVNGGSSLEVESLMTRFLDDTFCWRQVIILWKSSKYKKNGIVCLEKKPMA